MSDAQRQAALAKRNEVFAKLKKLNDGDNQSKSSSERSRDRNDRDDRGGSRSRRERSRSGGRDERSSSRRRYDDRSRHSEYRDRRDRSRESSRRRRSRDSSRFSKHSPSPQPRTPQSTTFSPSPASSHYTRNLTSTTPSAPAPARSINLLDIQRKISEAKSHLVGGSAGIRGSILPQAPKGGFNLKALFDQGIIPQRQTLATKRREPPATEQAPPKESKILKVEPPPRDFTDPTKNPYFDPALATKSAPIGRVPRRTFKFVEPGKYIQQAEQERAKADLEKLRQEIAERVKKTGVETERSVTDKVLKERQNEVLPEAEWWDTPFLPNKTYKDLDQSPVDPTKLDSLVTIYIHHPAPVKSPKDAVKIKAREVMLTKVERKKLRRQRRREAQKDKQDKIRLGLLPPDPPKVKISNLMRVLGDEAIQDPTKIEAKVRREMELRQKMHDMANEQRKLTPEERRAKIAAKIKEDTQQGIYVAVFKIRNCSHPKHRHKIEVNAKQHGLNGMVIVHPKCHMVIVEGGQKAIKAYRKLMLRRIDWTDLPPPKDASAAMEVDNYQVSTGETENRCFLVWEGQVKSGAFRKMTWQTFESEKMAREELERKKVEHYWDAALLASDEELAARQPMELS